MGTKMAAAFAKLYFHNLGRNRDLKSKRFKIARLETIHWWHLPLGHNPAEKRLHNRFNKHHQTIKVPLKYPKQKQTSWTLLFTKRKDLKASRCTHFSTGHISIWSKKRLHQRRGSIKKLLRTSSSKTLFEESITNFKTHLLERGYPENFSALLKTEKKPSDRNKNKTRKII